MIRNKQTISIFFSLSFLILLFSSPLFGQQYVVKGVVVDSLSKEKLFFVSVGLTTPDSLATIICYGTTDQEGSFRLETRKGDYLLKISYSSIGTIVRPLTIDGTKDTLDLGTILVNSKVKMLKGVTVAGTKPVYAVDGEKTLYNVAEDPAIQGGNASDALQHAPGVEVDIEGNITLRGVSSVEIWINDHPSHLEAENLKTYLQQLPANAIERIEVINNPSAKYSAKGTGGIINIVLNTNIKKNNFYSFGINGSSRPSINPWFSFVWSNEKFTFNLYTNFLYYHWKMNNDSWSIFRNENMDTTVYQTSKSKYTNRQMQGGIYLNGDYQIDSMNTLSFWAGGYDVYYKQVTFDEQMRHDYIPNSALYRYTYDYDYTGSHGGGWLGTWYEHKFNTDGHNIQASLHAGTWQSNNSFTSKKLFQEGNNPNVYRKGAGKWGEVSLDASIDYTVPYHKDGEIGIGFNSSFSPENANNGSDTLLFGTTDTYLPDSMRYKMERVKPFEFEPYITLQHKFGNFTMKYGLRYELIHYNYKMLNSPKDNFTKTYSKSFYPSVHLSYKTKTMHNFTLSYTRRVNNPDADELSTSIEYNEDSYATGNPHLLQTFTNSVNAGWTKYFEKFGSVGLTAYFRNSTNDINEMSDVIYDDYFGRIVSFTYPVNSGKTYTSGGEANVTYKLKTYMNIRFYANMYYRHLDTKYENSDLGRDEHIINNNFVYSFRLNFWAKLWKVLEINASANYRSKDKTIYIEKRPTYSIDCGLRADLLKRKISLFLNVTDIFNWNKSVNNTDNPYYTAYNSRKFTSRSIMGGITIRLGKMELESKVKQGAVETGGGMQGGH